MLRSLRRLPALVAILALSLIAGPTASALCAHLAMAEGMEAMASDVPMPPRAPMDHGSAMVSGAMHHGITPAPAESPCHEAPVEMPPPAHEMPTDCIAPCCTATSPPSVVVTAPAASVAVAVPMVRTPVVWTEVQAERPRHEGRPPPLRLYLETGRVRV